MVKVVMEVVQESARFKVSVQAKTIRQAEALVRSQYPAGYTRLLFPIEPEDFFVRDPASPPFVVAI